MFREEALFAVRFYYGMMCCMPEGSCVCREECCLQSERVLCRKDVCKGRNDF